jgi:hypothetical protein
MMPGSYGPICSPTYMNISYCFSLLHSHTSSVPILSQLMSWSCFIEKKEAALAKALPQSYPLLLPTLLTCVQVLALSPVAVAVGGCPNAWTWGTSLSTPSHVSVLLYNKSP